MMPAFWKRYGTRTLLCLVLLLVATGSFLGSCAAGYSGGRSAALALQGQVVEPPVPASLIPLYQQMAGELQGCPGVTPSFLAAQDRVSTNFGGLGLADNGAGVGRLTVASWNAFTGNAYGLVAGFRAISQTADVIGFQELGVAKHRRLLANSFGASFAISGDRSTPIFWRRSKFTLVSEETVPQIPRLSVEYGASGNDYGPKWLQITRLRVKSTGAVVTFMSQHVIATANRGAKFDPSRPKRERVYKRQMSMAMEQVDKYRRLGVVMLMEDGNYDQEAEAKAKVKQAGGPYLTFEAHGMWTNWRSLGFGPRATHTDRYIDLVAATRSRSAMPVSHTVLSGAWAGRSSRRSSDHHPVLVTYVGTATAAASKPVASLALGVAGFTAAEWQRFGRDGDGDGRRDVRSPADSIKAQADRACELAKAVAKVPGDPVANLLYAYKLGAYAVIRSEGVAPSAEVKAYAAQVKAAMIEVSPAFAPAPATATPGTGNGDAASVGHITIPDGGVYGAPVTSSYGRRFHPVLHIWKTHDGTDFGAGCGQEIQVLAAGQVVSSKYLGGYGNQVRVSHGSIGGHVIETSYSHMSKRIVKGGTVSAGQTLGLVGRTGFATGCHLHLMVYVDGKSVDPLNNPYVSR